MWILLCVAWCVCSIGLSANGDSIQSCSYLCRIKDTGLSPQMPNYSRIGTSVSTALGQALTSISQSLHKEVSLSLPCFTDSKVALCWIRGIDKDWKLFVQKRVLEIRRFLPPECWRHCQGRDNPANIPFRGCTPHDFSVNRLLGAGPDWLPEGRFGNSYPDLPMPQVFMTYMNAKDLDRVHRQLTTMGPSGLCQIIKCKNFSTPDDYCEWLHTY